MKYTIIDTAISTQYNKTVTHPLQSYEWGEFRKATGQKVIRIGFYEEEKLTRAFTMTLHSIPKTKWFVGYLPKTQLPTAAQVEAIREIGKKQDCIFVQVEPNEPHSEPANNILLSLGLRRAARPLFTRFTFILDLSKSEDELLTNLHPKTRYNIRVAQRHNVSISERNTDDAFSTYLRIMGETTKRQRFFAHSETYHKIQWETLTHEAKSPYNQLSSHLLVANYNMKTLAAWLLFVFRDTLYYPYGASSSEHRETMASSLMMWEVIKFGKALGLKWFDMWGALGIDPDQHDPWYGFHKFKQGFRPEHREFVGSYDLVLNPALYRIYVMVDKIRWLLLKVRP